MNISEKLLIKYFNNNGYTFEIIPEGPECGKTADFDVVSPNNVRFIVEVKELTANEEEKAAARELIEKGMCSRSLKPGRRIYNEIKQGASQLGRYRELGIPCVLVIYDNIVVDGCRPLGRNYYFIRPEQMDFGMYGQQAAYFKIDRDKKKLDYLFEGRGGNKQTTEDRRLYISAVSCLFETDDGGLIILSYHNYFADHRLPLTVFSHGTDRHFKKPDHPDLCPQKWVQVSADNNATAQKVEKAGTGERPGYKKTKVGWIPEDWDCVKLGECFSQCKARGESGLPIFSVTQDKGLVQRDTVGRQVVSSLKPEHCALVEPGDLAYNMMRMWQGAVDVCKERGVVSPAYVVCRPHTALVDSNFMFLYFKSPKGLSKLRSYSYGVVDDRLRLYFKDFRLVPAPLPTLKEQTAISEIIKCLDEMFGRYQLKLEKKRNFKKGLMKRLLSGKQRLNGFSSEWESYTLGRVVDIHYGKDWKEVASEDGAYSVYGTGGCIGNATKPLFLPPAIILGRKGTIDSPIYIDEPFWAVDTTYIIKPVSNINMTFLHATLQNIRWKNYNEASGVPSLSRNTIQKIKIFLPEESEQNAIAAILSTADDEITAIERKIAAIKEQKRFLINNLVTGAIRLPQFVGKG